MSARAWAAFAGVSTLWGIPYLFIKVAVDDGVPPVVVAWTRVTLGAVILLVLAARAGTLGALKGRGRWLLAYALLEIAIPFPLIGYGEQRVASSLTAIIIAATPLIVALLALRFDAEERVSGSRLVGLLVGFAGVVALVGIDVAGSARELVGAGAVLLASVGYAAGPMLMNRTLADGDPKAVMGVSLAIASAVLAVPAVLTAPDELPSGDGLASIVVLGVFCTAAAFALFGGLIAEVGPGRALVITYIAPIVAVALGVTVLGEQVGAGAVAGLLLILAGSWLSTGGGWPDRRTRPGRRASRRARTAEPEPPGGGFASARGGFIRTWPSRRSPTTRRASAAPASHS